TYMSKPHMILAGNDIPDHSPGRGAQEITDEVLARELAPYGPMGSDPSALLAWHMRESAHRVLYTTLHSRAMDGIDADSLVLMLTPWWVTLLNTVRIILAVLAAASGIWLLADIIKNRRRA
ncbi:MAG: beta-glucosidase, partial [Lachnospiraceae bacterium]|nr:beta-glucosidase [Lachnospiraceae bacterium]